MEELEYYIITKMEEEDAHWENEEHSDYYIALEEILEKLREIKEGK